MSDPALFNCPVLLVLTFGLYLRLHHCSSRSSSTRCRSCRLLTSTYVFLSQNSAYSRLSVMSAAQFQDSVKNGLYSNWEMVNNAKERKR